MMIKFLILPFLFVFSFLFIPYTGITQNKQDQSDIKFDQYFISKTLRIDYLLAGDKKSETAFLDQIKQEPNWGGNHKNLIDVYNLGSYRVLMIDSATGQTIYSKGFSSLFQEWQGTEEAKTVKRAFAMTAVMPYPLKTVKVKIERRRFEDGEFNDLLEINVNPSDFMIPRENPSIVPYIKLKDNGDPAQKVDIAFIAEGYTDKEMSKFIKDAQKICDYFLSISPYSENRSKFNFYAILAPSEESGVDNPGKNQYANTSMNSSFYTFGMDRYLTTPDTRRIYDIAANVPYDAIFILVNSSTYGGGGFFNHYAETTVDNPYAKNVAIHEFGHSFAGLGDEYMGDVSYSDLYNLKVEPWEPNLTTNVNFAAKWQNLIVSGTPIPTPRTTEYKNTIGMFEGGGYVREGIYSPYQDCRMRTNEAPGFCPVCQRAIRRMIQYYSE